MRWSLTQSTPSPAWKKESRKFLAWLDAHAGRIDISDPALNARHRACADP
jgi:hypothetical protein